MSRFLDLLAIVPGIVLPTAADIEDDPNGWLFCDGRAVSRTTYAALFTAIGTKYGAGDGSTTFNLPDLRGRVPAGRDNMGGTAANRLTTAGSGVDGVALGAAGGSETHVLTGLQMPSHSHSIRVNASGTGGSAFVETSVGDTNLGHVSSLTSGQGEAHNNTQPTLVLNYLIKT